MLDMIIIGAGPAGISMASEARAAGVEPSGILILEKAEEHSFSLKKYYPENKLVTANYKGVEAVCTGVMCIVDLSKHQTISYLDQTIRETNARVHYSESVVAMRKVPQEQRFTLTTDKSSYDCSVVVVAIGILGKPNKPPYRIPPSLRSRALFDLTTTEVAGAEVLVVGGGDSASEYCQYLVEKGNRVTLSYRGEKFVRMNDINLKSILALAERSEVQILFRSNVSALSDERGRPRVRFAEGQFGERTYDYVIYALGGTTPRNFLKTIGIAFEGDAPFVKEGHETNVPGLFLIGDLAAGQQGGSINWAFNSANTAMRRICRQYLSCRALPGSPEPETD